MSQSDLSRASNVTTAQISRIISGQRNPGKDTLTAFARALKLPPELVFEKAGILPPKNDLSPIKRAAINIVENLSEEDAAFIENFLRSYAQSKK